MITGILIGVCIMSLSAIIAAQLIDSGKEYAGLIFLGPVAWILFIVCGSAYKFYKWLKIRYFRKHYTAIWLMVKGKYWETYYVRNELVDAFYKLEDNRDKYIEVKTICQDITHIPPKYRIITKNGFKSTNQNCKFITESIRPYWKDFRDKIASGDG